MAQAQKDIEEAQKQALKTNQSWPQLHNKEQLVLSLAWTIGSHMSPAYGWKIVVYPGQFEHIVEVKAQQ